MTWSVPSSGVTVESDEFEQLRVARAWGYKVGRTEFWDELPRAERVRLIAFERVSSHAEAVINHQQHLKEQMRRNEDALAQQMAPQGS